MFYIYYLEGRKFRGKNYSGIVGLANFVGFIFAIGSFIVKFQEFNLALDRSQRPQGRNNYEIILMTGISSFI